MVQGVENTSTNTSISSMMENDDNSVANDGEQHPGMHVSTSITNGSIKSDEDNVVRAGAAAAGAAGGKGTRVGSRLEQQEDDDAMQDDMISSGGTSKCLASKETRQVSRYRVCVVSIVVLCAILVGVGAYSFTRRYEKNKCDESFVDDANKMLQSLGTNVIETFAALDSFATSFVSSAHTANASFPYVNIQGYANRVSKLQSMNPGLAIWTYVIVKAEQREQYEDFAWTTKRTLVNDTLKIQATDPSYHGKDSFDVQFNYSIHGDYDAIPYNVTRDFMVLSQRYPITSFDFPAFNWDWYATLGNDYLYRMMETGQPVLSPPYVLPDPNIQAEVQQAEYWGNLFGALVPPGEDPVEPVCDVCYPVYDNLDKIQLTPNDTNPSSIVGAVTSPFYWRDMIKNILPDSRAGIDVVFENPCKANFTYRIIGGKVKYVGRGDYHECKYDSRRVQSTIFALKNKSNVMSRYTGIPVDEEFCTYRISVYHTKEYENEFETSNPVIFASLIVIVFAFVCVAFLLYDNMVEQRQEVVMNSALRSNAVVSSLFPSNVRDKILYEANIVQGTQADASCRKLSLTTSSKDSNDKITSNKQSTYERHKMRNASVISGGAYICILDSPPIADLYPETTVFFADIAGFTKWGSSRSPNDVFVMLETLYGSFDNIARSQRIFKVETIGDSYVAVVGLPEPRKHHATAMVEFSRAVLVAMKEVTHALVSRLGPDVQNLNLRVGLNSGPTTAGVLRGEKSRFQLFGDTVNTAARMESNGLPGRIHCSESTTNCLILDGNGAWLIQRVDRVEAKGKGVLQTYWIESNPAPSSSIADCVNQCSDEYLTDDKDECIDLTF